MSLSSGPAMAAQRVGLIARGYAYAEADAMSTARAFRASWTPRPPKIHQAIAGVLGREIVSWIHLMIRDDDVALIESLFVHVDRRDNDYARLLTREAIRRTRSLGVENLDVYALDCDIDNDALWEHLLR